MAFRVRACACGTARSPGAGVRDDQEPQSPAIIMNTRLANALVLAAALSATALIATGAPSAVGYPASAVTKTSWNDLLERTESSLVAPGSSRVEVLAIMGRPTRALSQDVWEFEGYQPDAEVAVRRGCTHLVVTFAHERVARLAFVNSPAVELIAAMTTRHRAEHIARSK